LPSFPFFYYQYNSDIQKNYSNTIPHEYSNTIPHEYYLLMDYTDY